MALKQKICRALLYPLLWRAIGMPGHSHVGPLAELTAEHREIEKNLRRIVNKLVLEIGERNSRNHAGLVHSERYIADQFREMGYRVRCETFEHAGVAMQNVEAERRGSTHPEEIILFGAHIDTVYGSAGADDNASGLSILLELARLLANFIPGRTIRFVAFGNEENQNSPWEMMGSYRYAKGCHDRKEKIVGMISLEMLGVYSDAPGSQQYPLPFSLLYPEVGNFVAFIGNLASREWVHRCIGKFREQTPFPSEGVAAPDMFRDINRSDQWSFWQFGYPGIMLTDTSNFRNKLYHTAKDTPEILDFERMARLTAGLAEMLKDVANE